MLSSTSTSTLSATSSTTSFPRELSRQDDNHELTSLHRQVTEKRNNLTTTTPMESTPYFYNDNKKKETTTEFAYPSPLPQSTVDTVLEENTTVDDAVDGVHQHIVVESQGIALARFRKPIIPPNHHYQQREIQLSSPTSSEEEKEDNNNNNNNDEQAQQYNNQVNDKEESEEGKQRPQLQHEQGTNNLIVPKSKNPNGADAILPTKQLLKVHRQAATARGVLTGGLIGGLIAGPPGLVIGGAVAGVAANKASKAIERRAQRNYEQERFESFAKRSPATQGCLV